MDWVIALFEKILGEGYIRRLFLIIVVLILFRVLLRLAKKYTAKLVKNESLDSKKRTLIPVLYQIIRILLLFIAICFLLQILGISTTPVIAVTSSLSVVVGIGAQQVIKDVINGVLILTEDIFNIGDDVHVAGVEGRVMELGLRTTRLRNSASGEVFIVPNSAIQVIKNASIDYLYAKADISIPTYYDSKKVLQLIEAKILELYNPEDMIEAPILKGITSISQDSIEITVTCKVYANKKSKVESEVLMQIKQEIDKNYENLMI